VIALECAFGGRLDEDVLATAAEYLLEVEPILGFRLVPDGPAPHWQQVPAAERRILSVVETAAGYDAFRRAGQNPAAGAQVTLCLWRAEAGDRLLLRMTHVAGDGVSLQLLASRLGSLYSAVAHDRDYRPERGRLQTRDVRQLVGRVPRLARLRALAEFAWFMAPRFLPRSTHRLPLPESSAGPWVPVIRHLPAPAIATLSQYGKERGATVNDVLLAAAYRALAAHEWDGRSGLRIPMTVDLRRWFLPPEHAATIANLSSWEQPYLMRELGGTFDETLRRVSALTRRRKRSRPGLAIGLITLRLVKNLPERAPTSGGGAKTISQGGGRPALLTFSNEGLLAAERFRFADEVPLTAHTLPPFTRLPAAHLSLSGYRGALTLAAVTPENGAGALGRFIDTMVAELPAARGM
jgi:NRPS condensation-like uncharacterized protein